MNSELKVRAESDPLAWLELARQWFPIAVQRPVDVAIYDDKWTLDELAEVGATLWRNFAVIDEDWQQIREDEYDRGYKKGLSDAATGL